MGKESFELRLGKKMSLLDGQFGEGILSGRNSLGKGLEGWHILLEYSFGNFKGGKVES